MTTEFLLNAYFNKYPDSLTAFVNFPDSERSKAMIEMQRAMDGERGALKDEEFNQSIPEGADA